MLLYLFRSRMRVIGAEPCLTTRVADWIAVARAGSAEAMTAEPFSTSMFLDLPPTPRRPDDGDDAILAYISRMLLEEEDEGIDDHNFFYQYYPSDHPTLLQAQEPYARILSMADTEKDNEDMLNRLAFEKGREEATKLLPVTSSLLAATSLTREDSNNKRQNIDWDDCLEGETGRESKVMVPEPEESSDVVDDMIVNAYGLCLKRVEGTHALCHVHMGCR